MGKFYQTIWWKNKIGSTILNYLWWQFLPWLKALSSIDKIIFEMFFCKKVLILKNSHKFNSSLINEIIKDWLMLKVWFYSLILTVFLLLNIG